MRAFVPVLSLGLLATAACGGALEDVAAPADEFPTTERARGIYIPITPAASALAATESTYALTEALPIYMHRWGGTYTGGNDDSSQNRSSVVGSGSATVDAYAGGDAAWDDVMACVTDQFSRFNAVVTDVEPLSGDYIEAVIGGLPQQVGLPNGVGGVAPIDTYSCNIISDAVVYIFSGALPDNTQLLCEIAAQEIAHALSLDHELLCDDPMTYLQACGNQTFQDVDAQCGEYSARQCDCGRPSQNSVQILYDKLGPSDGAVPPPPIDDNGPPTVDIVQPADGASLPPNTQIQVVATANDDNGLAAMELIWEYSGDTFACPIQGNGYSCTVTNGQYVWDLTVGTGSRTFQVRGRDVAGNIVTTPARTINLDGDGGDPGEPPPPPVQDTEAPEVAVASPVDGATLSANSVIEITVSASDDVEVTDIGLEWDYSGDTFGCPMQQQAVSCTRTGSTYRWQVNVGTGDRSYRVRASDAAGQLSVTETRTIHLSETVVLPPRDDNYEDNDTWDAATGIPCSSGLDLTIQPGDDDFLMAAVAPGVQVTAAVTSSAGAALELALISGPRSADVLATATTTSSTELAAIAATSSVALRVSGTSEGDYRVVISCTEPDPNNPPNDPGTGNDPAVDPGAQQPDRDIGGVSVDLNPGARQAGCSQASDAAPAWALLGLLGLAGARRRRR